MYNKEALTTPSRRKGTFIEALCILMMILSIGVGIVGAIVFGEVSFASLYTSESEAGFSPKVVGYWLLFGGVSAIFWLAVSGIGTLVSWHEFKHRNSAQSDRSRGEYC